MASFLMVLCQFRHKHIGILYIRRSVFMNGVKKISPEVLRQQQAEQKLIKERKEKKLKKKRAKRREEKNWKKRQRNNASKKRKKTPSNLEASSHEEASPQVSSKKI